MATWDEVRAYMRKSYKLLEEDESKISLLFGFDDNRKQSILLTRFELLDLERALKLNGRSVVGYLALDRDGIYVMRHTALLSTLDPDELVIPLHVMVKAADKLEEESTGLDMW
jgi:hypothetical protein